MLDLISQHCVKLVKLSFRYSRPTNYVMINTRENNWIQFKHKFFLSLWHPGDSEIVHFFFPVLWRTLSLSSSDVSRYFTFKFYFLFFHLIKRRNDFYYLFSKCIVYFYMRFSDNLFKATGIQKSQSSKKQQEIKNKFNRSNKEIILFENMD